MKKYKIILELLLAVVLMIAGYYIYKIAMNMRHDMPIIKGLVIEDIVETKGPNQFDKNIYAVATFTEKTRNLQATITYPVGRDDIFASIKLDYEKFKLENADEINDEGSTSTLAGGDSSGIPDIHFSYEVNYKELATSSQITDSKSYTFGYYKYVGGAAHGESGMRSYNYIGDKKMDNAYDTYLKIFSSSDRSKILKNKSQFYKKLHDEAKIQIVKDLKKNYEGDPGSTEDAVIDMKWAEEGLSYSATNTINYDTWWVKGDSLYIYIAPYQIGPYSYGDRKVKILLDTLR